MNLASLWAKAQHTRLSVCEVRLLRQSERELGRWPTSSGPRDCCLVSPETEAQHGHPVPDDIPGLDDDKALAALRARAMKPIFDDDLA